MNSIPKIKVRIKASKEWADKLTYGSLERRRKLRWIRFLERCLERVKDSTVTVQEFTSERY